MPPAQDARFDPQKPNREDSDRALAKSADLVKYPAHGRVAEWSIVSDSKSDVGQPTVGSNPTPSAILTPDSILLGMDTKAAKESP